MALDPSNSRNLEQLTFKGLNCSIVHISAAPGTASVTYYPAGGQQQQPQQLVINQPPVVVTTQQPPPSFVLHILLSCCVAWCCFWPCGLLAFILACKTVHISLVFKVSVNVFNRLNPFTADPVKALHSAILV